MDINKVISFVRMSVCLFDSLSVYLSVCLSVYISGLFLPCLVLPVCLSGHSS